jgi:hypothetical protein
MDGLDQDDPATVKMWTGRLCSTLEELTIYSRGPLGTKVPA